MEHDDICKGHTSWIDELRTRTHDSANYATVASETSRLLTLRIEENTVALNQHNLQFVKLEGDLKILCERLPKDLIKEFTEVRGKLDTLHADFSLLRRQAYVVITAVLLAGVGAIMDFVLKGGLTR